MKLLSIKGWSRRIDRETREQPGGESVQECASCGLRRWKHKTKETCPRCGGPLVTTSGQCNPPVPTMEQDSHE